MQNVVYNQIKSHIKDGMLKTAANLLQSQVRDSRYTECFIRLFQMATRMQQEIGPLSHDTYVSLLMLNFPVVKGGVQSE